MIFCHLTNSLQVAHMVWCQVDEFTGCELNNLDVLVIFYGIFEFAIVVSRLDGQQA